MHSLENWSAQLWFLLINENMLKNIATSRNERKTKGKNMASYKTDNLLFLIWLTSLAMIENRFENRFKEVTIKFVKIHYRIRSYSGPHFPASGLNTERYGVSLRIHCKCGKIQTRVTPNTETFYAITIIAKFSFLLSISHEFPEQIMEI